MGKIKDLEAELASTQSKTGEASKAFQRAERKAKELAFAQGEDRKNQDRMSELASKLQGKIKTYKQQIEEAEEMGALNLAKFRKAQQELEEVEERAKLVASGGKLQQVQVVHLHCVNSWDVPECLGNSLILVIDDERSQLLDTSPVPQLSPC